MKKTAIHYAIVRFMPFVETGEFANVGVVTYTPATNTFGFKLLTAKRRGRVMRFFNDIEPQLFTYAINNLKAELERIQSDNGQATTQGNLAFFNELIRPRETIIRFSEAGVKLGVDHAAELNMLFEYYVERNFVTKEYKEAAMERGIKTLLGQAKVAQLFSKQKLGDEKYEVTFPFVQENKGVAERVIKPLHLGQKTYTEILDHGGQWDFKLRQLKERSVLPSKLLVTFEGPDDHGKRADASKQVIEMLQEHDVNVVPQTNQAAVFDFVSGIH